MAGHGDRRLVRPIGCAVAVLGHSFIIIGAMTIPQSDHRRQRRARRGPRHPPGVAGLLAWYRRSRRDLPWRRTRDPYRIWISEIMLQQTTVRTVVPYYRRFIRLFPTVQALASARAVEVLAAWSGLGYYGRARNLRAAARIIVDRHSGRFPRHLEDALALPGVGRSTAGAILSIAHGARLPVLDGNVARVLSRLYLVRGPKSAARERRLWGLAADLVAAAPSSGDLNQALMELGATVCAPVSPACTVCPLSRRLPAARGRRSRSVPPSPWCHAEGASCCAAVAIGASCEACGSSPRSAPAAAATGCASRWAGPSPPSGTRSPTAASG
ncbi:MAG: hypothetical protein AUH92_02435 [Acidobacteria bacterium 13_1_40CM_4_69_4]|nr:MAG: hypothetical protein AUH92_02435 [Acidobacteria bacterium 13_1_40CM_4_69_4]